MLVVFFAFWVAPGQIFELPGTILEGLNSHFSMFCRARILAMQKVSRYAKTIVFPQFLYAFYTSQALCSSHKTTQNRSQSLSNRASDKDCAKNTSWDGFLKGLALSWASLGRLLSSLGRLQASFGCLLGVSWALLGRSWLSLGWSGELQGRILTPRIVPGLNFRGLGDVPD